MKVKDHRGLTVSLWNRYYRAFNRHFARCGLDMDLNQTFEIATLATRSMNLKDSGTEIQRIFRRFMVANGFSRKGGNWVRREFKFGDDAWDMFTEKGVFPKQEV